MRQIIQNYLPLEQLTTIPKGIPVGGSCSPKQMIFHILDNNNHSVEVLDIGFGLGGLGEMVKASNETSHWHVDGIDGWEANCLNKELASKKIYRNIWHGFAQELTVETLQKYKIICLLDVIEHLDVETAKYLFRTLLTGMGNDSFLFISTPLWFMPQEAIQEDDLEEHLIGIPASSMLSLIPKMYCLGMATVGGFVYSKMSLKYIDFFQPTPNKNFTQEMGINILKSLNIPHQPGILYKI
jgi:2-polyprenyl-3-methyl-5-hydroxy-6-metoxy-1,4-benzoquinol methylase